MGDHGWICLALSVMYNLHVVVERQHQASLQLVGLLSLHVQHLHQFGQIPVIKNKETTSVPYTPVPSHNTLSISQL